MKIRFDFLERRLSKYFCFYAKIVTKWPTPFIVFPVIISLSMAYGFVWRFQVIKDDLSLYTPTDGRTKIEKESLDRYFHINETDPYFSARRFDTRRSGYILIETKNETSSIIDDVIFAEVYKLWTDVEKKFTISYDGKLYNYSDLCVRTKGIKEDVCIKNPLLMVFEKDSHKMPILDYPYYAYSYTMGRFWMGIPFFIELPLFLGNVLGGVTVSSDEKVVYADAVLLPYQLKHSTRLMDKAAEEWEKKLDVLLSNYRTENISVYWWTSETLTSETLKDTQKLLKLLVPMFLLVTTFTVGCCFVNNMLRSKPCLGLCGVISACLSIISAMGLLLLGGEELTSVTYFVPFITFSVGVDNVFILIAAWRKTNVFSSVSHRMVGSFHDAAVSITVTSLTDAVSFGVGCMSNFPSVKNFCLYACIAIIFVYTYQLTFFSGCMVISGIREKQNRNCLTLKIMKPVKSTRKKNVSGTEKIADHAAARFFRGAYTNCLLHPVTKFLVILVLFVYLAVAIWGITLMVVGIYPADLLPKDSHARKTLLMTEKYFTDYSDIVHLWFTKLPHNYSSSFWEMLNEEVVSKFENTSFSTPSQDSWYFHFNEYLDQKKNVSKEFSSEEFVDLFNVFVGSRFYGIHSRDVKFKENDTTIEAVRFPIRLKRITFSNHYQVATLFRKLADQAPFGAHVYQEFFKIADQFDAIVPSIMSNMAIGTLTIIVACLLLIPKPMCSIWVCITIFSINVGIFGYMSLWGVHLDFVSMVTIIMSIGQSVDFSAHIAYHFAKERNKNAEQRVRESLYVLGTPIVQSAFSTWLGIVLISVVDSYTFRSFVKTCSLVILFGMLHGLVVLPVFLVVFDCNKYKNGVSRSDSNVKSISSKSSDQQSTSKSPYSKITKVDTK